MQNKQGNETIRDENCLSLIHSTLRLMDRYLKERHHLYNSRVPTPLPFVVDRKDEAKNTGSPGMVHQRVNFAADISLVTDQGESIGEAINISPSGILVNFDDTELVVNQRVTLNIKPKDKDVTYSTLAQVVRQQLPDGTNSKQYALKFNVF